MNLPRVPTLSNHYQLTRHFQRIYPILNPYVTFRNKFFFFRVLNLAPRPAPTIDSPLVGCSRQRTNTFTTILHTYRPCYPTAAWRRPVLWWQGLTLDTRLTLVQLNVNAFRGPVTILIDSDTLSKILHDNFLGEVIGCQEINRFPQTSL